MKSIFTLEEQRNCPKAPEGKVKILNQYTFLVNHRNKVVDLEDEYLILEINEEEKNCKNFFENFINMEYGTNDLEKIEKLIKEQKSTTKMLRKKSET